MVEKVSAKMVVPMNQTGVQATKKGGKEEIVVFQGNAVNQKGQEDEFGPSQQYSYDIDYGRLANTKYESEELNERMMSAIKEVNDDLADFSYNFPGRKIKLDPFPLPAQTGKKEKVYNQWKTKVAIWKDTMQDRIKDARRQSTSSEIQSAKNEIIATQVSTYADLKGGQKQMVDMLIEQNLLTASGFNMLLQQMDNNCEKVLKYINRAKNQIMQNDNKNAQQIVQNTNDNTRAIMRNDNRNANAILNAALDLYIQDEINTGKIIANTNEQNAQTRETDGAVSNINSNLNGDGAIHTDSTRNQIGELQQSIISDTSISHDTKMVLLNEITKLATQQIITDSEIKQIVDKYNFARGIN